MTAAFQRFLDGLENTATLAILGDLFDVWVGDDDLNQAHHLVVVAALATAAERGVTISVMHGNRDFLLGADFMRAAGATLLADPTVIDLYGTPTLLCHGDTLCSADLEYQKLRGQIRTPQWIATFLARPLAERLAFAAKLRADSEAEKYRKDSASMDATAEAVTAALRDHACRRLIHGHTHRPACHPLEVDGQSAERWVLPAWEDAPGGLRCDAEGCKPIRIGG